MGVHQDVSVDKRILLLMSKGNKLKEIRAELISQGISPNSESMIDKKMKKFKETYRAKTNFQLALRVCRYGLNQLDFNTIEYLSEKDLSNELQINGKIEPEKKLNVDVEILKLMGKGFDAIDIPNQLKIKGISPNSESIIDKKIRTFKKLYHAKTSFQLGVKVYEHGYSRLQSKQALDKREIKLLENKKKSEEKRTRKRSVKR